MNYQLEFRPYRRKFVRVVTTSHGIWDTREGIILRLTDKTGKVGWGEIAPISWFGSETLDQALIFCSQLPTEVTQKTIFSIPNELPACQFGFESALWTMKKWESGKSAEKHTSLLFPTSSDFPLFYSALLPAGEAALEAWQTLWQQGYSTFKWKIGVYKTLLELEILELLIHRLPASATLRLDANGGLSENEARLWLAKCDKINFNDKLSPKIEFIEQPLPVDKLPAMLELSNCYQTAIALDESVATLKQLEYCFRQGWRGIFVIKPAIAGYPSHLRQFCQQHQIDAVFSSVFETVIGRQAALQLATELSQSHKSNRAVGFGINHWFAEDDAIWLKNLW